jgi:hypothetical protein
VWWRPRNYKNRFWFQEGTKNFSCARTVAGGADVAALSRGYSARRTRAGRLLRVMLLRGSILSSPIQGENSAHTKETDTDQMQQRSMGAALKQFEVQRGRNDLRPDFTDGLRGLVTIGAGGVIKLLVYRGERWQCQFPFSSCFEPPNVCP